MGWDFQIVQVTAAGTFGTVVVAFDWTSRQFYALKVLRERFRGDERVSARAQDEATMLAAIRHPNVLAVHSVLEVAGRPIIVMEWVRGCSLQDLLDCQEAGLPPDVALAIVGQSCRALDAAYRTVSPATGRPMHIIHRDLKPSNILLGLDGTVKVVDFGIAHGTFEGKQSETLSMVLGARDYMAPERLDGAEDTPRLDVYAMGLMLLALLHGEHIRLSLRPRVHGLQKADALDGLDLRDASPTVARGIKELFSRMTEYEPSDRPTSAQVVETIERIQSPPPDLDSFANAAVRPIFEANSLMDPRRHDDYADLAFLDEMGPTAPGGNPNIDRDLRRFLNQKDWPHRVEELWTLLLLNPSWTARPFLEWLDARTPQWWQFWQPNPTKVHHKVALLRILACRIDERVRVRVKRFTTDGDPRIRKLAKALLTAEEVTAF